MDMYTLQNSSQKPLEDHLSAQMDFSALAPPPGLGHLAQLAPPPGLQAPTDLAPPPGLEPPADFAPPPGLKLPAELAPPPERPPGHFKSAPQRPPGIFSVQERPHPLHQLPLEALLFDLQPSCAWQQPAFPPGFNLLPSAQQPIRPPGNWENVSVASTAAPTPIVGSPRRDEAVSSDEDDMLQTTTVLHHVMPESSWKGALNEQNVCQSLSEAGSPAELKAREAQVDHGSDLICWQVDAKKLRSNERQIISPSFKISQQASIKMMIKPKSAGERKGQAGFRSSRGLGSVEVKFVEGSAVAPKLRFCISVGDQPQRGPFEHDFGSSSVCSLPQDMEEWDFSSCVNPESSSFLVSLQVLAVTPSCALAKEVLG
mmetsp:Transcript_133581/g.236376  ORF Transcript_133581/g.236376 Transcript_133581/m.236376 type:complete len:371 (+) Transcript_133581:67-1179(+)